MDNIVSVVGNALLADQIDKVLFRSFGVNLASKTFEQLIGMTWEEGQSFIVIFHCEELGVRTTELLLYCKQHNLVPVALADEYSETLREELGRQFVFDIVLTQNADFADHLKSIIHRIDKNRSIKVLVVDDSRVSRVLTSDILRQQRFVVLSAKDGTEGLQVLKENADIKLVITDEIMPNMTGSELTSAIRKERTSHELAIIGFSSYGNPNMTVNFLKKGANDFLIKPFNAEELICRINQNIEILEQIKEIRESAIKDFLTGLYNRRYFFEIGDKLYAHARRKGVELSVAFADIDFFKSVNDTYGHVVGDEVLKSVSGIFKKALRKSDVIARVGGEEFAIILMATKGQNAFNVCEKMRSEIENSIITIAETKLQVSISIGVCDDIEIGFDEMVKQADEALYRAKNEGRNRVMLGC